MIEKQISFLAKTAAGISVQPLFGSSGIFEKVAGAPAFADWETGEKLREFLSTVTAQDRKDACYTLVNALGAGEYFGSNINADHFPWDALTHEGKDYGYLTFLDSHAFQHHKNKDSARAFGVPVRSFLNNPMKRVELIIRLDREKARQEGADGIVSRIDAGEFPDVSMGCRVPYDVCSICGNKAKTRADYCEHMAPPPERRHMWGPNKILEDGRRICVINTFPKFFDISFVFIGADKTAKVMAKLASRGDSLCMGNVCAIPMDKTAALVKYTKPKRSSVTPLQKTASMYYEEDGLHGPCGSCCSSCAKKDSCHTDKLAEAFEGKTAAQKVSEIVKAVPSGDFAPGGRFSTMVASEPSIKKTDLNELANHNLSAVVSTLGSAGIVLKPQEFQRIVLVRMGEPGLADELERNTQVFRPSSLVDSSVKVDPSQNLAALLPLIQRLMGERSAFGQPFQIRITISKTPHNSLPTPNGVDHPLLSKIGAAYNGYRRSLLTKISQAKKAAISDPQLREMLMGNDLVNAFSKKASHTPLVSINSLAYLMGAHLSDPALFDTTAVADAIAETLPQL